MTKCDPIFGYLIGKNVATSDKSGRPLGCGADTGVNSAPRLVRPVFWDLLGPICWSFHAGSLLPGVEAEEVS